MGPLASTNANGKPLQTQSICLGNAIDSLFTCLTTRAGVAFIKWCEFSPCRVYCQHLECYGLKLGEKTRRITTLSLVCGNHSSKRYVFAKGTGTAEGRFETRGTHKAWLSWNATPSTQTDIPHLSLLIVIFKIYVFLLACVWLFLGLFLLGFWSVLLRVM